MYRVFPEWWRPDDWCEVPFTHTITQTTCHGLPYFNLGSSLYLVEDRAPQSGEMFIWCQKSFDGLPTSPVWGRFMASTAKGDKVLTTMGDIVVLPRGLGPLPTAWRSLRPHAAVELGQAAGIVARAAFLPVESN